MNHKHDLEGLFPLGRNWFAVCVCGWQSDLYVQQLKAAMEHRGHANRASETEVVKP